MTNIISSHHGNAQLNQPTFRNQWEILASTYFPEHIGTGDYKGIVMAEQALRDNGILSRFASDGEQARWLTNLLGWEVNYRYLNTVRRRFVTRDNSKDEDPRYLDFVDFYRERAALYHELERNLLTKAILSTNVYKR